MNVFQGGMDEGNGSEVIILMSKNQKLFVQGAERLMFRFNLSKTTRISIQNLLFIFSVPSEAFLKLIRFPREVLSPPFPNNL
jgi:hypothetical protein